MKPEPEIDATLHLIGSIQPPSGLERRVLGRLYAPRRGTAAVHFVSAAAIAASVAIAAVSLAPPLRDLRKGSAAAPAHLVPRAAAPPQGAFGAASAVHLPAVPVRVQPTPVSQGRGRARSASTILPGRRIPLPRGAALPHRVHNHISTVPVTSIRRVASVGP